MKIALVSPYDFPYPGGVTEHVRNLARCLSDVGHHVRIIAPSSRDDVEVVHPEVYRVGSHITSESRAANVGTFHCARDRYVGYALGRQVFRALLSRLDARITVSAEAHRFINSYFPHQYSPIPNGVETDHDPISDVCPEVMQDGTPTVLFLGRLERRKGLAVLIEAMNLVAARVSPIRLVVAGPFSEFAAGPFRELSHRLGLKDVVFVGQVSDTLRKQLYRHATVFCAPSTGRESQGIVLLEAMAAGTPVVASDIPGYRTALVHGESGLLAVAQDAASLAHCLVQAIGNERVRRTVIAGGLIAANRFSWKVIAPKILTVYETAIRSRTSTRFFSMPGMLRETGTFNSRFAGPAAS
ncbi:MAG: glycosyltransferase family 1 protein [Chloroflexi bacterium]|nr:glycosyltransferase family 1 protein [Chloroflexota bacterium]